MTEEWLLAKIRELVDSRLPLLVEQSVATALDLADRVLCLERGTIAYEGDAAELRERPHLLEAVYLEGVASALAEEGELR